MPASSHSQTPTDYVAIAIAYAEDAIDDRRRKSYGRWIRFAAARFIRDLRRSMGPRPPFNFAPKWANAHCQFIEGLPHVEETWATAHLLLQPAQIFFVVNLFGFRNHDGGRRFSEALLCVARKNAKSTLAAAILLSCLCLEKQMGPQVIAAATTGGQARIVFNIAKRMVERTQTLRDVFDLEPYANAIARPEIGGTFKPINSKASTQDGLNPSHTELDEIHAHKTHDLLNVLRSAAGARKNALWLYTTTEGYENPGPWGEIRAFAYQVLQRLFRADHFLALIYALDDEDDDFDEKTWVKANPLLPVMPNMRSEMRKLATNAKAMPGTHAEFRIKKLNRRAASATAWLNLHKWNTRCAGAVDLDFLAGKPCWGAFDLASTTDMCAWRLLWKWENIFYTWGRYWVPEEAVAQRTERRSVPYAGWVGLGFVTQTQGDVADYGVITRDIVSDYQRFSPRIIGYDTWNAAQVAQDLVAQGLPLEQFIQGPKSYNPGMKACELAYTPGRLRHGSNPVLRWNMANVVARKDANLNEAPDRKRSADKIDGACCLFMDFALHVADTAGDLDSYLANPVSA